MREITASAPGAVRVLEVRGPESIATLARLFSRRLPRSGSLAVGRLEIADEALDEVLIVARADGSFELHLHGSGAVVERVSSAFVSTADAPSTRRERALELLSHTRTEAAARVLLDQAEGALERECTALLGLSTDEQNRRLDALLEAARWGEDLVTPRAVVLVGPTNAGKSTLFNVLVGSSRVLVSPIAGTTRDAVTEPWEVAGFPVRLTDTAGWREVLGAQPADEVELLGQARGRALAERADLIVWASADASEPPELVRRRRWVQLRLQADLDQEGAGAGVSARTDPAAAAEALSSLVTVAFSWPREPWSPGRGVPVEPADRELIEAARATTGSARGREIARIVERTPDAG